MPDTLLLLSQIAGILVTARLVGRAVALIGQPRVVGEMLAGIMLGPSLLGWVAPGLFHQLFPPASLGFLNALSQIGLVFFMFLIGLELDLKLLRGQGRAAVITSHASIIAPSSWARAWRCSSIHASPTTASASRRSRSSSAQP